MINMDYAGTGAARKDTAALRMLNRVLSVLARDAGLAHLQAAHQKET